MRCARIQKLIPLYLDNALQPDESQQVKSHLSICDSCQTEAHAYQEAWEKLGMFRGMDPEPGFVGRFWTRLAQEKPWWSRMWESGLRWLFQPKWAPAFVTICTLVLIGSFAVKNYYYVQKTNQQLARLSQDDIEMVENLDLMENYELIRDMDLLADLEVIERLNNGG